MLPAGSTVLFRERTLWSEYKWQISGLIGLLVGQSLLIGALLVERRHRRRAQKGLAEAEQRYRTVADFTADWEFWKRPDGSFAYMSPSCLALTGYDANAFLERPALLTEIIVDEDLAIWTEHRQQAQGISVPAQPSFASGREAARFAGSNTCVRPSSARMVEILAFADRIAMSP